MHRITAMDENLKDFLYKKLHDEEITSTEQILTEGYIEGFEQNTLLNALQVLVENNLIAIPAVSFNIGSIHKDFFINKSQFTILKPEK
ncbi:TPA: hypothetical protein ACTZ5V_004972 [Bacillus cereus]